MIEVRNQTLAEKLAAELAQVILQRGFEPGSRLDEHMLAERFRVSRTPVREALRQLAATGLIEMRPRRGAFVARVTAEQLGELFVAMGEIEATCARLSAIQMTPIERRRLEALHKSMGEAAREGKHDAYVEANRNFHACIYAGSHNKVLSDFATALRQRLEPFRSAQFGTVGRVPRSHSEHDQVVRAILSGDAEAAHAAMLHHVSLIEEALEELVEPRNGIAP